MKTKVEIISKEQEESAHIHVHKIDSRIEKVLQLLENEELFLTGEADGVRYKLPFSEIFYIEVVDKKCFIYTEDLVCQSGEKLYQLEEKLHHFHFVRISKSMLVNIEVIQGISPLLSGRFEALLINGERVAISRKYVTELKKGLGMEK